MLFRHVCISDCDVDVAGLLERGFEILPRCCITFDKSGAGGRAVRGRCEVKDEGFGAFGGENLDGCKADA